MKYILEHYYFFSADKSTMIVPIHTYTDLKEAEEICLARNEHQIKFHGDSKDFSIYRVRWIKDQDR